MEICRLLRTSSRELAALAWEDVDLEKGIVNVRRNLTILDMFGPPKTNAGIRTVTLLQPALEALKEQYKLTGHHRKSEITFIIGSTAEPKSKNCILFSCPGCVTENKNLITR